MPTGTQDGRKRLYLDFDGYFAAVEEQATPARPPGGGAPVPGGADLCDLGERGGEASRGRDRNRGGRGAAALPRDRPGEPAPGSLRAACGDRDGVGAVGRAAEGVAGGVGEQREAGEARPRRVIATASGPGGERRGCGPGPGKSEDGTRGGAPFVSWPFSGRRSRALDRGAKMPRAGGSVKPEGQARR